MVAFFWQGSKVIEFSIYDNNFKGEILYCLEFVQISLEGVTPRGEQ